MSAQALTQVDPQQVFRFPSTNATGVQRLDTKVSGVAVSNDFSGQLSVTTAEGATITLSADLESDFRAVNYTSHTEGDGQVVDVRAKYAEYSLKQEFGVTVEGDLNEQEVKDLEKLFRKVANIFKQYVSGQDEEALAKTAKLAERFGHLSSLSGLDPSVDVERSVTIFAAQAASEVTNLPARTADQQQQTPVTTSGTATPGVAPSTVAAIPQSSTGISAPTQPSTDVVTRRPVSLRRRRMRRTQSLLCSKSCTHWKHRRLNRTRSTSICRTFSGNCVRICMTNCAVIVNRRLRLPLPDHRSPPPLW